MFELKNSRPVKETDRVRFRCTRCGECCRHAYGVVVVESLDIFCLSKHFGIETADFISQYTDQFILDEETQYPIFTLKVTGQNQACIFLKGSKCTVQENKPRTCRMYPFWVEVNSGEGSDFAYHFSTEQPHPRGSILRVKDWMKDNFSAGDRDYLKEEGRVIPQIAALIHSAVKVNVVIDEISRLILYFRYLAYDMDKPFFEQHIRNNRALIVALKRLLL